MSLTEENITVEDIQSNRNIPKLLEKTDRTKCVIERHIIFWIKRYAEGAPEEDIDIHTYMTMMDEIETLFDEYFDVGMVNTDENSFLTVTGMLESIIIFIGNSLSNGIVRHVDMVNLLKVKYNDLELAGYPTLTLSLNVLLGILIKQLNKIQFPGESANNSDKENKNSAQKHANVNSSDFDTFLRIVDLASKKSDNNLRSYVLTKNLLSSITMNFRKPKKTLSSYQQVNKIVEILCYFRQDIDECLGLHIYRKEYYSAYCIFTRFLSSIKLHFLDHQLEFLELFKSEELNAIHLSVKIDLTLRHVEHILKRGVLRFERPNVIDGMSRFAAVRLDENEDIRCIMHSFHSILNCFLHVGEKSMSADKFMNLAKQSYFEIAEIMSPNWKKIEKSLPNELTTIVEEIREELDSRM